MLENTIETVEPRIAIPRSIKITDKAKVNKLTRSLVNDMRQGYYMVSISSQQLSGVAFVFSDMFTYHLQYDSGEIELDDDLTLKTLESLVKEHFDSDFMKLLNANVEAREDGERAFIRKLICFVDYVDSANRYYLEEGQWYEFDTNYLRYLQDTVRLIPVDFDPEIRVFDEGRYEEWLREQKEDRKKEYREKYLNEFLARKFGYMNYDRRFFSYQSISVEIADLVKEDKFVFVKIGKPQKLNYVVDQSINALSILQRNGFSLTIKDTQHTIKTITLWIFLERENDISSIAEIQSLVFLMKLAAWRKAVLLSGLSPEIRVSYIRKATSPKSK